MTDEVLVCREGEIADGDVRLIKVGPVEIGVIRHKGSYYAYRNLCPHQGGPVCEGLKLPQVVDLIG
jgi:nitrite reductase/ring-hydroxylating ferredoxin subunit